MAAKKKEEQSAKIESKRERLLNKLKEEKKLAEKADETIKIGALDDFREVRRDNYVVTGMLGYDLNVGGIKKGTFNVLYGAESSGKSTTALNLIEGIQMSEPEALTLYVDAETTVDEKFLSRMPYINKENIIFLKEAIAEFAFNKIIEYAEENLVDYVVVDSIDSLISIKEAEKGLEDNIMMEKARIISRALPKLQSFCRENNLTVIFIQQVRTQFAGMFAVEGRSGGKAMKYYPATVVKLSNISSQNEVDSNGQTIYRYVKIKNEKSKIGNPYTETFSYISTTGEKVSVDRMKECLEYACLYDIISQKGAWVYIPDENGELKSINGKTKAMQEFRKDVDLYSLTKLRIYGKALDPEIFISKFDDIITMLKTENKLMKANKINLLTAIGMQDMIDERDYKELNLDETATPENYMDEQVYKKAKFEMLSSEEQEEFLKKIKEEQKQQEKDEPIIIVE